MTWMGIPEEKVTHHQINPTAKMAYRKGGPGIGGGAEAIERHPPEKGSYVLDIGFGDCNLIRGALDRDCVVFGADIAEASWRLAQTGRKRDGTREIRSEIGFLKEGFIPFLLDVCHDPLPMPDDVIDWAYCLETPEHLTNPYFAFAEVKRVLKHRGKFVVAFPRPESNLGYEGGKHPHVYPGFLQKDSFERFMMQLYFRKLQRDEHGDTAWYLYENLKEGGDFYDTFFMIKGTYTEDKLYGWVKKKNGQEK